MTSTSGTSMVFVFGLIAVQGFGLGQTTPTQINIKASDPRALAQAAFQLEQQLGVPINYEDIAYMFSGDVVNVTASVMTAEQKNAHPDARVLVPRGGQLSTSTTLGSVSIAGIAPIVSTLVSSHNSNQLPGVYISLFADGAFYLKPTQARNASGSLEAVKPILDTQVSLPVQQRTAGDTLDEILKQVSLKSGIKVEVGRVPMNLMLQSHVSTTASNEPARTVIARLFLSIAPGQIADGSTVPLLAYQLFFDPGTKYYMFNAHTVPVKPGASRVQKASEPSATAPNPYAHAGK